MNINQDYFHPITINEVPVQFEGEVLAISPTKDPQWSTLTLRPSSSNTSPSRPTEYAISPDAAIAVGDLITANLAWSDQRYILASPRTLRSKHAPLSFDRAGQSDFFSIGLLSTQTA